MGLQKKSRVLFRLGRLEQLLGETPGSVQLAARIVKHPQSSQHREELCRALEALTQPQCSGIGVFDVRSAVALSEMRNRF
jgi:hypothetical protein